MGKKWDTTLSCRWFMKTGKKKNFYNVHNVYKEL